MARTCFVILTGQLEQLRHRKGGDKLGYKSLELFLSIYLVSVPGYFLRVDDGKKMTFSWILRKRKNE